MKNLKLITATLGIALLAAIIPVKLKAQTGEEIAWKVYNRASPSDGESDMTMTLINSKGKERVRYLHQFLKDYEEVEKKVMFFKAPADVKNTSFLNYSYDDDRDDDQWLYLPALKKVKRISGGSKDDYFMGSDFTYEDLEKRSPKKDVHKLLKQETLNGEQCYVIESTPKEEGQYSKRVAWVIKDKWIPLKIEFYDEDEELLKVLTIPEFKQINGYWTIITQDMRNVQRSHKTVIKLSNIELEKGLGDEKFTQRAMMKGL
ncbi:MAG: outer membrane lipoprotein-sorting protein [Cyclobacteriaceae bacterium]|nr:outer membrane lipoprotein-sorting protein [Cyclobacteriaceae bacterium]